MSVDTTWTITGRKRWEIAAELELVSPLHIGCGEVAERKAITDREGNVTDINAVIKGKDKLPIIPGSTIKGRLRQWLQSKGIDAPALEAIFGKGHNPDNSDQGSGGQAEFHDALICHRLDALQPNYPYWQKNTQTYVESSSAIDRHKKTALLQSLHHREVVPPKVRFKLTITGVLADDKADILLAALEKLRTPDSGFYLGAGDASGKGRVNLFGNIKASYMDDQSIISWLKSLDNTKNPPMAMVSESCKVLGKDEIYQRIQPLQEKFFSQQQNPQIGITLQFDGPFIVNDPREKEDNFDRLPDKTPLLAGDGKPILPASSFRGALRSQAERIIRTLGGHCCDTEHPCKAVYEKTAVEKKLCLACQVFGANGWKTTLHIRDFTCIKIDRFEQQDFVAIDRFHGGGKHGAKFDIRYSERPCFTGAIELTPRMQIWGKGLLALVLRDLQEYDITLGFGANKGYGNLESVSIPKIDVLAAFIPEFRKKCGQTQAKYPCLGVQTPDQKNQENLSSIQSSQNPPVNSFLNPYNFIPLKKPDISTWLPKDSLNKNAHHSHAYYRNKTDNGKQIYNGRITCILEAETPFFIGSTDDKESDPDQSAILKNYKLNNQIAIPATSLRGMVSSLAEAASNSAMRVLKNGELSFRKDASKAMRNVGMVVVNKDNRFILPLVDTNNAIKLKGAYENNPRMQNFIEENESWSPIHNKVFYLPRTKYLGCVPDPVFQEGMRCGILRILGKDENRKNELENKKHELFIEIPEKYVNKNDNTFAYDEYIKDNKYSLVKVSDSAWERYHALADERSLSQKRDKDLKSDTSCSSTKWLPFHLKGAKRKRNGKEGVCLLPLSKYALVFYRQQSNKSNVTEISFSAIWRGRVEDNSTPSLVHSFFPEDLLPFNDKRKTISPAELLFGFTELNETRKEKALTFAGKVRVNAGIPQGKFADDDLLEPQLVTLKALSSPKLPSPALYFTNKDEQEVYVSKQELSCRKHKGKGRKMYLHAQCQQDAPVKIQQLNETGQPSQSGNRENPWVTLHPEVRPHLKVQVKPIRKNTKFLFHVDFNNLTKWEIGLLCFALRPNDNFRHKLGMGKPLGLGTVRIDIAALQTIDRKKRYAEDPVDAERFNQTTWVNPSCREELVTSGFHPTVSTTPLEPEQLKGIFIQTMDKDIYRAIDLMGNPANVHCPVHYPQVKGEDIEDKNFQWFVANDSGSEAGRNKFDAAMDVLGSIAKDTDALPILTRHQWNNT